mmetsp:Transcript_30743/g.88788  ORF Transcript_30743/g.88788 Transcript_30743/m.88788 type:complete len:363 (-) Transcript_30743:759-1847(-)
MKRKERARWHVGEAMRLRDRGAPYHSTLFAAAEDRGSRSPLPQVDEGARDWVRPQVTIKLHRGQKGNVHAVAIRDVALRPERRNRPGRCQCLHICRPDTVVGIKGGRRARRSILKARHEPAVLNLSPRMCTIHGQYHRGGERGDHRKALVRDGCQCALDGDFGPEIRTAAFRHLLLRNSENRGTALELATLDGIDGDRSASEDDEGLQVLAQSHFRSRCRWSAIQQELFGRPSGRGQHADERVLQSEIHSDGMRVLRCRSQGCRGLTVAPHPLAVDEEDANVAGRRCKCHSVNLREGVLPNLACLPIVANLPWADRLRDVTDGAAHWRRLLGNDEELHADGLRPHEPRLFGSPSEFDFVSRP